MKRKIWMIIVVIFILVGHVYALEPFYFSTADYDISLYKAERPSEARNRYGEQKVQQTHEGGISKFYFEDEMVQILWTPSSSGISFYLTNKTAHSIKIIWDEASFIDEKSLGHRVMHSGVKYIDRNNPQPPTVVVRKGSVTDIIVPTDKVYWREGYFGKYISSPGGWEELSLFPDFSVSSGSEQLRAAVEKYKGKTFQILLPLQIENTVNEYIFTFKINDVVITNKVMTEGGEIRKREDRRYVNKDKGFSVAFPEGWEVKENYMGLTIVALGPFKSPYMPISLSILAHELPTNLTRSEQDLAFDNFIATLKKDPNIVIREVSNANLNNVQGKFCIYDLKNPPFKNMNFSTGRGHRMFIFAFSSEEGQFQEKRSQVEQILRSFNFE
ncbi:MAG: hypothetical protein HGA78_00700 [Nitrospirales bacterium]|nr:hypothetical protein [Nitrospirales bacterium]